MKLRPFLTLTGVLIACSLAVWGCGDAPDPGPTQAGETGTPRAERPVRGTGTPVILIVVDTLRDDHLSHNGYARSTSPRLKDWSKRAAHFERTYATSPWTLPSFGSILTGMSPIAHAAGFVVPAQGDSRFENPAGMRLGGEDRFFARLDSDVATLAEILYDAGYATGAVLNNPFLHQRFGLARGFESYDHEAGSDFETRRADVMVDRALAWIDGQTGGAFFLLLHLFDPHMNYDAPPPFRGRYTTSITSNYTLPIVGSPPLRRAAPTLKERDRRYITAAYDEEVAFVDHETVRFLRDLEKRGLTGNGLILLTADHGEELFDHSSFGHGHTLHEEQLRVPLLLWGNGVSSSRIEVPVSIMDIPPTILEALELEVPSAMEGISLWPAVHRGSPPPDRPIFSERRESPPERKAVVWWPYKLTLGAEGTSPSLFDLSADPGETHDLSTTKPRVLSVLGAMLRERFELDAGRGVVERAEVEEGAVEQLRALGYLD